MDGCRMAESGGDTSDFHAGLQSSVGGFDKSWTFSTLRSQLSFLGYSTNDE
ncbi:hypothetical protein KIN20_003413 [Parelaphostrongylus tenuis]|uniref:Uncharacterized protein n=1 Tax=Parelaphostrongylus tenuis TaxID=148309 RepID=A0AAD5MIC1_PARTN|nr:hypothetical protein KIN20_003413 [Parelaphostrongylus tenuis]